MTHQTAADHIAGLAEQLFPVSSHACPTCHGRGGKLPNGQTYCNCMDLDDVVLLATSARDFDTRRRAVHAVYAMGMRDGAEAAAEAIRGPL